MRLGLGTVQFGLDYGVSNTTGRTGPEEAARILSAARAAGVRVLDTAAAYGDSERVLGRLLEPGHGFAVVTKLMPPGQGRELTPDMAWRSLEGSLERTGQERFHGIMVHHASDLLAPGGEALFAAMEDMRVQGLAGRIGCSLYHGAQVDALLERFEPGIVQIPVNALDQRLVAGGQLERLAARGVEVHARSVFLQGLLLMDPEGLDPWFEPVRGHLAAWRAFVEEACMTPVQAAMAFMRTVPGVDTVLVGVNTAAQLVANVEDFARPCPDLDFAPFALDDERFVNPAKWELAA